jgi:hypothetical protein
MDRDEERLRLDADGRRGLRDAVAVARANVRRHGLADRIIVCHRPPWSPSQSGGISSVARTVR